MTAESLMTWTCHCCMKKWSMRTHMKANGEFVNYFQPTFYGMHLCEDCLVPVTDAIDRVMKNFHASYTSGI